MYVVETQSPDRFTSAATNLTIFIIDANDNAPRFSSNHFRFHVNETAPVGAEIGFVSATDGDGGSFWSLSFYAILAESFEIGEKDGVLRVAKDLTNRRGQGVRDKSGNGIVDFIVRAVDNINNSSNINDNHNNKTKQRRNTETHKHNKTTTQQNDDSTERQIDKTTNQQYQQKNETTTQQQTRQPQHINNTDRKSVV